METTMMQTENGRSIEVMECEDAEIATVSVADSEVNMQIATAHRFPRSLKKFRDRALAMATMDEETAESCFYVLPRGGKNIEGPSVRLAEIIGSAYTNMRYGARIVAEDSQFVTAQGMAFDLENNVAMTIEVRRRITDKYGKKFNADMIGVTANAACSIALRNAIFKVVPKAFVNPIYEAAKKAAVGDVQTLATRRARALEHFNKMGVSKDRVFLSIGVAGIEDIDLPALEKLIGISTAIKDGELTVDAAFPITSPTLAGEEPAKNKTDAIAKKVSSKVSAPPPVEPAPVPATKEESVVIAKSPSADDTHFKQQEEMYYLLQKNNKTIDELKAWATINLKGTTKISEIAGDDFLKAVAWIEGAK